jgi:hypothetical protein
MSARTGTAAARSAADIGTAIGSSIVTGIVREPRPPRSPFTLHHELINCPRRPSIRQDYGEPLYPSRRTFA